MLIGFREEEEREKQALASSSIYIEQESKPPFSVWDNAPTNSHIGQGTTVIFKTSWA